MAQGLKWNIKKKERCMVHEIVTKLTKCSGLLLAVVVAAIVGGVTTAVVSAAIPDSSNTIHGCYRNNAGLTNPKGGLRVIDSDTSQSCTAQETALNWSSGSAHQIAYAGINSDGTLDTGYSSDINSATVTPVSSDPADGYNLCIDMNFTPKAVTVTGGQTTDALIRGVPGQGAGIDLRCGSQYEAAYYFASVSAVYLGLFN
jgi:hypothetical protein